MSVQSHLMSTESRRQTRPNESFLAISVSVCFFFSFLLLWQCSMSLEKKKKLIKTTVAFCFLRVLKYPSFYRGCAWKETAKFLTDFGLKVSQKLPFEKLMLDLICFLEAMIGNTQRKSSQFLAILKQPGIWLKLLPHWEVKHHRVLHWLSKQHGSVSCWWQLLLLTLFLFPAL